MGTLIISIVSTLFAANLGTSAPLSRTYFGRRPHLPSREGISLLKGKGCLFQCFRCQEHHPIFG